MPAKKGGARAVKTWKSKTVTPKNRRSGMRAAPHLSTTTVRPQLPQRDVRFEQETTMRHAFSNVQAKVSNVTLARRVLKALAGRAGLFGTKGWMVINRSGGNVERRS